MAETLCIVCKMAPSVLLKNIEGVSYFQCESCQSIFADRSAIDSGVGGSRQYDDNYWSFETADARMRCFGAGPVRVAETMLYARKEVKNFIDISCGTGFLLDAMDILNTDFADRMVGIEPFPPPPKWQSQHKNFRVGMLSSLEGPFEAGVCIEVIEHVWPDTLSTIISDLAKISTEGSLYYFNSGQPAFVKKNNYAYLDPFRRGHVVSYSVKGVRTIFAESGFVVHELPGRDWGFLAEFAGGAPENPEQIYRRLWTPVPENLSLLRRGKFGSLLHTVGLESARCYLELGLRGQ